MAGDIFQLGNTSYRILRVEPGSVRVEDAQGAAPTIPFWLGEAPGRSDELSFGVSRLRERGRRAARDARARRRRAPALARDDRPRRRGGAPDRRLPRARAAALGALPTQQRIVIERFFDESGGMQLVIHAPFGSRLNRAWGLALRKRFCRSSTSSCRRRRPKTRSCCRCRPATASRSTKSSRYLHSATALDVLVQALLDAPLFGVRWRWNATTALALPRFAGGRKVAPQLQRMRSEDLLAAVFPDQVACAENLAGEREIPDHPLVAQTLRRLPARGDGRRRLARAAAPASSGRGRGDRARPAGAVAARRRGAQRAALRVPRRRAARGAPHAGGAEPALRRSGKRRRPRPARRRRDRRACARKPGRSARNADEMHEALVALGVVDRRRGRRATPAGRRGWRRSRTRPRDATAARERRHGAACGSRPSAWRSCATLYPDAALQPADRRRRPSTPQASRRATRRCASCCARGWRPRAGDGRRACRAAGAGARRRRSSRCSRCRPKATCCTAASRRAPRRCRCEWCERHLLARIHRYTLKRLRREIEPVEPRDFVRFLFDWQHVGAASRVSGPDALPACWRSSKASRRRPRSGKPSCCRRACRTTRSPGSTTCAPPGRTLWTRLRPPAATAARGAAPSLRATPILLLPRRTAALWTRLAPAPRRRRRASARARSASPSTWPSTAPRSSTRSPHGVRLLPTELEDALAELVVRGRVNCDSFAGLRALLVPAVQALVGARAPAPRHRAVRHRGRRPLVAGAPARAERAGRRRGAGRVDADAIEHVARILLRRYGVVCWRLLEREAAWLPPWRDLVRVYRRLEARGEIRGGRFIAGLSGEQFALPEAIALMREVRRRPADELWSAWPPTDPANLLGTVLPGPKVARVAGSRVSVATACRWRPAWPARSSCWCRSIARAHAATARARARARPRRFAEAADAPREHAVVLSRSERACRGKQTARRAQRGELPRRTNRGSSRSRMPSPIRLSPSTPSAIATPGHTASCGA